MKRIFNGSGGRKAALILSLCLLTFWTEKEPESM